MAVVCGCIALFSSAFELTIYILHLSSASLLPLIHFFYSLSLLLSPLFFSLLTSFCHYPLLFFIFSSVLKSRIVLHPILSLLLPSSFSSFSLPSSIHVLSSYPPLLNMTLSSLPVPFPQLLYPSYSFPNLSFVFSCFAHFLFKNSPSTFNSSSCSPLLTLSSYSSS